LLLLLPLLLFSLLPEPQWFRCHVSGSVHPSRGPQGGCPSVGEERGPPIHDLFVDSFGGML